MLFSNQIRTIITSLIIWPCLAMSNTTLSMQQAEQLALENDALIKSHNEYALAYKQQSVASEQWPDPGMKFGFQSVPTDSFELDQEPMTQMIIGYSQMIPRGDSLLYETELMQVSSDMKLADLNLRQYQVRFSVRQMWLNVHFQEASEKIIQQNRHLFKQQLDVSQSLYSAGRNQQQDVLQAELELSLVDDRLQQIESKKNQARAQLARWVGVQAANSKLEVGDYLKNIRVDNNVDELLSRAQQHPEITKKRLKILSSNKKVNLAEQKYKPQWGFDLSYGKRSGQNIDGSDRSDFVTGFIKIDIPVFTEDKQDRVLSSTKKFLQASKYEQQDKILYLQSKINQLHEHLKKLKTRLELYDNKVLPQARQNSKAALNGYQSGVVSFIALTRARSVELKAQLQRLKLYNEQAQGYAEMRFLVGEE